MSWPLAGTCLVSLSKKSVCVCLHVSTPEAMIWIPYDKLKKFYNCYIVAVVVIVSRCKLKVDRNQPYKTKLELYKEFVIVI